MSVAAVDTEFGGKYRILAHLGQGGTANVHLAVARGPSGFNKLVVLKSMRASLRTEPEIATMFLSEARLAARLNHPNIVQTNEVFESADGPVIVMEYLEGQPLSQILHSARSTNQFPLIMHLRVLCEALAGLHHAHELVDFDGRPLNVVHRDMSPHNVFVTYEGQVKILDFGIAKLEGSHGETATGVIKGKLRYMSPEQVTGEGIDRRADIYAAGIMLWEAATGERMWRGLSDATVLNRILNEEAPPVRDVRQDVPDSLARIIHKALRSDKEERYASAAELLQEVEDFLTVEASTVVRPRQLGAVIAQLFDNERSQMRQIVENQLAKVASLSSAEYQATEVPELTLFGTHSGSRSTADPSHNGPGGLPRRTALWTFAAGSAFFTLIALIWFTRSSGPTATTTQAASVPPAPAQPSVPPPAHEPARVRIRVTAFPATAQLTIDGQPLPSNPFSREFGLDEERQITIEASADGYLTEQRSLTLDQDAEVVIVLDVEPEKSPAQTRPKVFRPTAPTPQPASAKKAACDPPFVIDAQGVKRFKPECL